MSKGVSGESLSELLGSSKGETFRVAPAGRGGAIWNSCGRISRKILKYFMLF